MNNAPIVENARTGGMRGGGRARRVWLVARTIFVEALRRREIYAIVLLTLAMLLVVSFTRLFDIRHLHKFYQEIALKTMSVATAMTVIVLGARQLPREFENRTIYPLMAKPIARVEFLLGKYLGVVAAGGFCLGLFMTVFVAGAVAMRSPVAWGVFAQFIYLQLLLVAVLAALAFLLSMTLNMDAAITISALVYLLGNVLTNALTMLYDYVGAAGRGTLVVLNYVVPQPALFDLSAKVVHDWPPVSAPILLLATFYALMFVVPYLGLSYVLFRRRAL
jgi:ABC-type transport system involved in multi-copper enzyme maturation permease subunit